MSNCGHFCGLAIIEHLDIYPYGVYIMDERYPGRVYRLYEVMKMSEIHDDSTRAEKDCCACSERHKERSPKEYKDLINRLNRIEGQVRGIKAMVERGAYCPDILIQTSAVNSALNSFSKVLLSNHIRTCVRNDIKDGNDEVVEELVTTLQKMMK